MDLERACETQRLKLLRFLAGLLAALAFVSVAPCSSVLSRFVGGAILSLLPRVEMAGRCLVIVQARLIAARIGLRIDHDRVADYFTQNGSEGGGSVSLSTLRDRLEALRALLEDLPRHGLRLLSRIKKRARRSQRRVPPSMPRADTVSFGLFGAWRLVATRIERPPDKRTASVVRVTSPRQRAGGEGGWGSCGHRHLAIADASL